MIWTHLKKMNGCFHLMMSDFLPSCFRYYRMISMRMRKKKNDNCCSICLVLKNDKYYWSDWE